MKNEMAEEDGVGPVKDEGTWLRTKDHKRMFDTILSSSINDPSKLLAVATVLARSFVAALSDNDNEVSRLEMALESLQHQFSSSSPSKNLRTARRDVLEVSADAYKRIHAVHAVVDAIDVALVLVDAANLSSSAKQEYVMRAFANVAGTCGTSNNGVQNVGWRPDFAECIRQHISFDDLTPKEDDDGWEIW